VCLGTYAHPFATLTERIDRRRRFGRRASVAARTNSGLLDDSGCTRYARNLAGTLFVLAGARRKFHFAGSLPTVPT
jgi:hypothetical protein